MMPIPIDYKTKKEPSYYSGKKYGYSARKVVEDFDLSYNVGTAVSYLLRAGKKEGNPAEQDIQKTDISDQNKYLLDQKIEVLKSISLN